MSRRTTWVAQRAKRRRKRWGLALVAVIAFGFVAITISLVRGGKSSHPRIQIATAVTPRWGGIKADSHKIPAAIHKIKHVVILMQENRSFDNLFGTFPGAEGIPMKNGVPTVCVPNPATDGCTRPFHDTTGVDTGGLHRDIDAKNDINGGAMDGFIRVAEANVEGCSYPDTECRTDPQKPDVMGYHNAHEIPNYWAYAKHFVLEDRMFAPTLGPTLPSHLYLVSGWSAACRTLSPMSCRSSTGEQKELDPDGSTQPDFRWTDLTYMLAEHHVSWRYYISGQTVPDCDNGFEPGECTPDPIPSVGSPEQRNVLPDFATVHTDHQLGNIQHYPDFFAAARTGTLPAVTWVVPDIKHSDHPREPLSAGQSWVTRLVNAIMQGPNWKSTAIFLSWDDWGGFYDHVVPPGIDSSGYGIRVPGLVISPYSRKGYVDHQTLSFDAYLKFIEDDFLAGRRIDPLVDGRPDSRPDVRENAPLLGNLMKSFDFKRPPRRPLLLPPNP
jgi:phospholipase C